MSRLRWMFAMTAAAVVGAACSDVPTGRATGAGTLTVRLTTPHADDGAVAFEVSGPSIDAVGAVNGSLRLFTRRVGATVVGVVIGAVARGAVVTLQVPDVGAAADYTARVVEVADRQNALRASLSGYALTVAQ